jgi:hypothetical protein
MDGTEERAKEVLAQMKKISVSHLHPFDVLLFPGRKLWFRYYHCAWFVGKVWGMRCNYESTDHGPELQEWKGGKLPQYVLRIKNITQEQKAAIVVMCHSLKDKKYDWLKFITEPLRSVGLTFNNIDRIRCDENIILPMKAAGFKMDLKENRPRAFLKSNLFTVYELRKGGE